MGVPLPLRPERFRLLPDEPLFRFDDAPADRFEEARHTLADIHTTHLLRRRGEAA